MKKILVYIILFCHVFFTGSIGDFFWTTHIQKSQAATTTISYAGTANDLGDSTMPWTNISNATGNTTGTSASSILVDRRVDGNTLALTNFNLAAAGLPSWATINGIQVDVEREWSNTRVRDTVIRLTKNGTTKVWDDKATDANGSGNKATSIYWWATDLWGTTWSAAELLSSNFWVHLQYLNRQNTDRTVDVYRVGITIDYTPNIAPTDISLSSNSIDEGLVTGTTIGTLTSTDANIWDTHTYSLSCATAWADDASFAISGANLNSNAVYDYATKSSYNICIRTTDSGSLTFDKNFTININNPNVILDFETAGWYTVTSGTWNRQSTTVFEWSFALEADNGWANNSTSCFERTETVSVDSIMKFNYKVSSEATYDFLRFYIDWVEQDSWSWEIDWTEYIVTWISAGTYTYRWCYTKDGSVNNGSDTAWIDFVTMEEDTSVTVWVLDFEVAGWYTVTSGTWTRQGVEVIEWAFAIEADNGGVANSSSCFTRDETLVNAADSFSFWYKVSSESGFDFLRFSVDGTEINTWSWEAWWSEYLYAPGATWTYTLEWCYTKDGSVDNGSDTAWIDDVGITTFTPPTDTTPPSISSPSFSSGALLPWGNHNIVINYSDTGSTIDTGTANIILNKWDGVSAWWPDISGTWLNSPTIGTWSTTYTTNNLAFWKYKYTFSIDDSAGNTGGGERTFYIDEPELVIGSGSIYLGYVDNFGADFSDTVTLIVRTVWAPFNLVFSNTTPPLYFPETIPTWDGSIGFWYQQSPFTSTISAINTNQVIGSEPLLINTNGNKNIYTYDIQMWALVDISQAAWEYIWDLKFDIILQY